MWYGMDYELAHAQRCLNRMAAPQMGLALGMKSRHLSLHFILNKAAAHEAYFGVHFQRRQWEVPYPLSCSVEELSRLEVGR